MTKATDLSLDIYGDAHGIVVRAQGVLDATTSGLLDEALTQLSIDPCHLRLDLRGLTSIDGDGIELIRDLDARCRANGGSLTLVSPTPTVLERMHAHRAREDLEIRDL